MRRSGWAWLVVVSMACGRTAPAPAPPPPAPAPAPVAETIPSIDEVRALRTAGQLDRYEHALKVLATSSDVKTRGRAEALLGLFYIDQNRHDDAVPYLRAAATDAPMIAPWMWLRIGDIPSVNLVLQQGSDETAGTIALLRITQLYAEVANVYATNGAFAVAQTVPMDEATDDDFARLAAALSKAGRADLAAPLRMRYLKEYPQSRYTEETYAALSKMTPSPLDRLNRSEVLEIAKKLGGQEHYDEALDLLQRFAARMPADAALPEYHELWLRSLFASRHYAEVIAATDAKSLHDAPLMLLRARALWRANKPQDFLAELKKIEKAFPKTDAATEAELLRAKYYTVDEPKLDIAIANLREVIAANVYGPEGEHLWTLGWTYFLANRFDDALRTFAEYQKRYPDGDYLTNALFWTGKIYDRLGKTAERDAAFEQLETVYPYNYFSYRARELRHQPMVAPSEIANGNAFPDLEAAMEPAHRIDQDRLNLIAELNWLGLYRDAIPNWKAMAAGYPDNPAIAMMFADEYVQAGEPLRANALLQRQFRTFIRHGGTGVPHRLWETLYPLAYWDVFQREGAKQNVDPYLLVSIARQESIFEPKTVSNAGAVGIMQIMPHEAARIAAAGGLAAPTREQLFDPNTNIAIGAAEYAQKRTAMNGNDMLAIAAYNAGTDAVGKWLAATPIDDGDVFVESIPYNETRLYVKTVTRNRFEYRRIYESSGSSTEPKK